MSPYSSLSELIITTSGLKLLAALKPLNLLTCGKG